MIRAACLRWRLFLASLLLIVVSFTPSALADPGEVAVESLQETRPQESAEDPHRRHSKGHEHGNSHGNEHGHGASRSAADAAYRHDSMHHDFSDAAHWSTRFDSAERLAWQKPKELTELLAIEPGMTAVDLGAGTGYFLPYLSAAVGDSGLVLGLDPEIGMVRFMSDRAEREGLANVESRQIPLDDPELATGTADRILIVNTWHHIQNREAYAAKLRVALSARGTVAIVDFTRDSPSGPPVAERLDPEQVIRELSEGGLDAELIEETLPRQYVVVGRRADTP